MHILFIKYLFGTIIAQPMATASLNGVSKNPVTFRTHVLL